MDPDKTWADLLEILNEGWQADPFYKQQMLDHSHDLLDWISARGFLPKKMLAAGLSIDGAKYLLRLINEDAQYRSAWHEIKGVRSSEEIVPDVMADAVSTGNSEPIPLSGGTRAEAIKQLTWTPADSVVARSEGWDLFDIGDGVLDLQREDEEGVFDTDFEAKQFVKQRAAEGSELHKKAFLCLTSAPSNWPTGNSPQEIIADALRKLEKIVMTDDVDAGVVLLPITGPDGSAPLGCALYDLWQTLKKGQPCTATDAPSNPSSTPTLST